MIDDLFTSDEPLNLLDDHFAEETTLRRPTGRQPSVDTKEVFSVQLPVFSEAQRFSPDDSTTTTLLVPVEHRTWQTEHSLLTQSENRSPKNEKPRPFVSRGLAAIAVVLLSVGGFLSLRDYAQTHPQPLIAAVESPDRETGQKQQYLSMNIRDLQVMQDRVLADNPLDDETESPLGEIVPAEWRVVRLEHTEPNGSRHIIERGMPLDELTTLTARPSSSSGDFEVDDSWQPGDPLPEYFDESGFPIDPSVVAAMLAERPAASDELVETPLVVGSTIFVDLPEHGVSANFTVTAILPCPTPNPGDGCLVTTKFIHENAEILDLRIQGSADVIGTTTSHPFWSEDRQQFVAAGDLRVGENLLLADDTTRCVESLTRRENRETVYNIEVDGEHVFYVGNDGVLVHNTCDSILLGQTMRRVNAVAGRHGWRTLGGLWTRQRNRDFLYHAMRNARKGTAQIFEFGFDPRRGYHGPKSITHWEMRRLVANGFKRRWTGEFVYSPSQREWIRLYEWVPK